MIQNIHMPTGRVSFIPIVKGDANTPSIRSENLSHTSHRMYLLKQKVISSFLRGIKGLRGEKSH